MATEYTEEQIAEVEAIIAERKRLAAEAAAALAAEQKAIEDEQLAPLRRWLASPHVVQVMEEFDDFVVAMRDMVRVSPYAYNFLDGLSGAAGPLPEDAPLVVEGDDEPAE